MVSLFGVEKPKLLTSEEAFKVTAIHNVQGVIISVVLGEGIYLYDDKITLELVKPKAIDISAMVEKPKAEYFHDTMTQRKSFELFVPQSLLENEVKKGSFTLKFSYQGCSELGICYQPESKEFTYKLKGGSVQNGAPLSEQDGIAARLMNENIALVLLSFFGFGLLLSLTPCVFPMIPILSSIIDKLYNRDYAINKNKAIIPTYLGIAVSQLLDNHYSDLFNEAFTAGMEERLDSISRTEDTYLDVLKSFYFGNKEFSGVSNLLDREIDIVKACSIDSSSGHLVRIGKYGPYIEEAEGNITIPNELMFGDLSEEEIHKIKNMSIEDNVVGTTDGGEKILLKSGKYGPYLETDNEKKRQSIPKMYRDILMTEELAKDLIDLPKLLGVHPESKENIMLYFGPYGPYLKYGKKNISIKNAQDPLSISLSEAIRLISEGNKTYEPTSLGKHPDSGKELIIKSGRYGPYITDGKRNISLKGKDIESLSLEEGIALFDE